MLMFFFFCLAFAGCFFFLQSLWILLEHGFSKKAFAYLSISFFIFALLLTMNDANETKKCEKISGTYIAEECVFPPGGM